MNCFIKNRSTYLRALPALVLLFCCTCIFGQTARIDSIRTILHRSKQGNKERLATLFAMCSQYGSLHPDSLDTYIQSAEKLAVAGGNYADISLVKYYEVQYESKKGKIDTAMLIVEDQLADKKVQALPIMVNKFRVTKTALLVRQNKLKEALENALDILNDADKSNSAEDQLKAQIQAGWVYMELNQNADALKWFFTALATNQKKRGLPEPSVLTSDIAAVYNDLKKDDSAIAFIERAIMLARQEQDLSCLCNCYYIYSDICIDLGQKEKAELLLQKGVEIRKKVGDPFYIIADLAQLGKFYANTNQYEKGIATISEGIGIAKESKLTARLLFLYSMLAENYKAANNLPQYSNTLETIINIKDSLYSQNSAEAMSELQTKYELQKKENTIIQQRLDLAQKNYWVYGTLSLLLFGTILWFLTVRNNKKKQEQKMALVVLEEKRLSEKAIAAAQEKERKRIAADLHDNLGAYAAAISSNVDHISMLQGNENKIYDELKGNAQAIVAQLNDTIWVLNREVLALTAISDRLKIFIQRLYNSYPEIRIDVQERIETDYLLPPIQAFHLFKILQEAISNALKHSGCNRIIIHIESSQNWKICIEDDGKGFSEEKKSTGGNGLINMKNRTLEAGWNIEWSTIKPHGTNVIISSTTN